MGLRSHANISFGVLFNEGHTFPWSEFDDCRKWWRSVNGYEAPFELYDDEGEYLNGRVPSPEQIKEYFKHRMDWDVANPLPFVEVEACSWEYPVRILAVPGTVFEADMGDPTELDLSEAMDPENMVRFQVAMLTWLECDEAPEWRLSTYMG